MKDLVASVRRFGSSRVGLALKLLVSLVLLLWFVWRIDASRLAELASALRWEYAVPLVLLGFFRVWVSALRFRWLSAGSSRLGMAPLMEQYFVAAYFNNLLPSSLGGDFVRLFMLAHSGLAKRIGGVLILIERSVGAVALLALAAIGVSTYDVPGELRFAVLLLTAGAAVLILFFMALPELPRRLAKRRSWDASFETLTAVGRRPGLLAGVFGLSLVLQVASIAVSWVVARALAIDVPLSAFIAVVPLVWLVTMLPISIGGIGLREASFAYLLGTVGVSTEASLLISLGTFGSLLLNGAVGGLLLATRTAHEGIAGARAARSVGAGEIDES